MITRIFICDICKESVGKSELFKVRTNLEIPEPPPYGNKLLSCEKDICRECLNKKGIITEMTSEDREKYAQKQKANQKTIEDKLIDLLVDLGVVFEE